MKTVFGFTVRSPDDYRTARLIILVFSSKRNRFKQLFSNFSL